MDLEAVRSMGVALPDVKDASGRRGAALKIKGRLFACTAIHKSAEPDSLMVRISGPLKALLAESCEFVRQHEAR